jgi:anti-anti-sigma factor
MNLQVDHLTPDTAVIHLDGRFDSSVLDTFKSDLFVGEQTKYLIADMAHTTFIDSLGLATLVSTLKVMRARGGDFYIASPTEVVQMLLELTRMDSVFQILATVDEALQAAQQGKNSQ